MAGLRARLRAPVQRGWNRELEVRGQVVRRAKLASTENPAIAPGSLFLGVIGEWCGWRREVGRVPGDTIGDAHTIKESGLSFARIVRSDIRACSADVRRGRAF